LLQKILLNRLPAKDEYNLVVAWMVSDSSKYFDGVIITADGG
jgi:hypothetical protein